MVSYFFRNHYRNQPDGGGSMIAGAVAKPASKPRRSSVAVRPPANTPRPVSTKPARPILSRIFGSRER